MVLYVSRDICISFEAVRKFYFELTAPGEEVEPHQTHRSARTALPEGAIDRIYRIIRIFQVQIKRLDTWRITDTMLLFTQKLSHRQNNRLYRGR